MAWTSDQPLLGKSTPEATRAAAAGESDAKARTDQSCEAAFYVGEYELLRQNENAAKALFQEAVNICSHTFVEYSDAIAELGA